MDTATPAGPITDSPVPLYKITTHGPFRGPADLHADWITENPDLWLCGAVARDDANNVVGILTMMFHHACV